MVKPRQFAVLAIVWQTDKAGVVTIVGADLQLDAHVTVLFSSAHYHEVKRPRLPRSAGRSIELAIALQSTAESRRTHRQRSQGYDEPETIVASAEGAGGNRGRTNAVQFLMRSKSCQPRSDWAGSGSTTDAASQSACGKCQNSHPPNRPMKTARPVAMPHRSQCRRHAARTRAGRAVVVEESSRPEFTVSLWGTITPEHVIGETLFRNGLRLNT